MVIYAFTNSLGLCAISGIVANEAALKSKVGKERSTWSILPSCKRFFFNN